MSERCDRNRDTMVNEAGHTMNVDSPGFQGKGHCLHVYRPEEKGAWTVTPCHVLRYDGSSFWHEIFICFQWSFASSDPYPSLEQFLELSQEVRHYGYVQLDPCTCDYPEPGCGAVLSVGNNEISCCITLPDNQTRDVIFQMNRVKCWQVTFLGTLLDTDGPQHTLNQNLELRLQYNEDSHWQWFVISTKQAFLLSSCLKKMISEKMVKQAAENPEMIEVPEQGKSKTYHSQQSQKDYSRFLPRKNKIKIAEVDCGFGTIKEEDL